MPQITLNFIPGSVTELLLRGGKLLSWKDGSPCRGQHCHLEVVSHKCLICAASLIALKGGGGGGGGEKSAAYTHFLTWTYIERPWLVKRHIE